MTKITHVNINKNFEFDRKNILRKVLKNKPRNKNKNKKHDDSHSKMYQILWMLKTTYKSLRLKKY